LWQPCWLLHALMCVAARVLLGSLCLI
jgi:hypothetical protein